MNKNEGIITDYSWIKRNMIYYAIKYFSENPLKSIWKNRHMNPWGFSENCRNKPICAEDVKSKPECDNNDVAVLVSCVVEKFKTNSIIIIDILEDLEKAAVESRTPPDNLEIKASQDLIDSLLVDFINYVAANMGVDYGMNVSDIRVEPHY